MDFWTEDFCTDIGISDSYDPLGFLKNKMQGKYLHTPLFYKSGRWFTPQIYTSEEVGDLTKIALQERELEALSSYPPTNFLSTILNRLWLWKGGTTPYRDYNKSSLLALFCSLWSIPCIFKRQCNRKNWNKKVSLWHFFKCQRSRVHYLYSPNHVSFFNIQPSHYCQSLCSW